MILNCGLSRRVNNDVAVHGAAIQIQIEAELRIAIGSRNLNITVDDALLAGNLYVYGRITGITAYVKCKAARGGVSIDSGVMDTCIAVVVGQGVGAVVRGVVQGQCHAVQTQVAVVLNENLRLLRSNGSVLKRNITVLQKLEAKTLGTVRTNQITIYSVGVSVKVDCQTTTGVDYNTVAGTICKQFDIAFSFVLIDSETALAVILGGNRGNSRDCLFEALVLGLADLCYIGSSACRNRHHGEHAYDHQHCKQNTDWPSDCFHDRIPPFNDRLRSSPFDDRSL